MANLLRIYSALEGISVHKSPQLFEGDNMFAFKEKLSNQIIDKVCPIGERAMNLCVKEEDRLLEILDEGASKASAVANTTMTAIKKQVGLLRRN